MFVPRPLIWQICFTGGRRLPKLTILTKEQCSAPTVSTSSSVAIVPFRVLPRLVKRLTETQYRYFHDGLDKSVPTANCRFCKALVYLPQGLELHKRNTDCRHRIDFLIEILARDHLCVMCERRSRRKRWGIPFCDDTCAEMFRAGSSEAWNKERSIVLQMKPGIRVGHVTL